MRRTTTVLTLAAVASTVALGLAAPAHAATPAMIRLTSAGDDLSTLTKTGDLAATKQIQVAVTLTDPYVAAEKRLLAAQAAGTADYTTPAAWDAAFAVPDAAAKAYATAHGLKVAQENGQHTYLLLTGTAAQVEKTFDVGLHTYTFDGKSYYATPDLPLVPAAAGIAGVLGLDDIRGAHTFDLTKTAKTDLTPGPTKPSDDQCLGGNRGECAFYIDDFTVAYDLGTTYTGQGQKIGIFGEGDYKTVESDLRKFEAQFERPQIPVRVVNVSDDQSDTAGTDEWDLDTQSSSGIARGAKELDLYFGNDLSDTSINASYVKWADDPQGPLQMNASFGECAPVAGGLSTPVINVPGVGGVGVGTQSIAAYDAQETALRQARAEGRTLFASTGDQGGSCGVGVPNAFENNVVPELNVPAGSVNAVGVGGTDLATDATTGKRTAEGGANAGGGGSSLGIHADTYQQGIKVTTVVATESGATAAGGTTLASCLFESPGSATPDTSGALCRSLPDVAALCGNLGIEAGYSGMNIYTGGLVQPVAGTSLASPLTMGMWARIQSSDKNPAGYGFANLTIYKLGKEMQNGQTTVDTTTTTVAPTTTTAAPSTATSAPASTSTAAASTTSSTTSATTSPATAAATQGVLGGLAAHDEADRSALRAATFVAPFYDVPNPTAYLGTFPVANTGGNTQHTTDTGYDQSTGWGVIDVQNFISDLPRVTTQVFSPVPPVTVTTPTKSTTTTGELAFTGLETGVPIAAVSLLTAGIAARVLSRRRRGEV